MADKTPYSSQSISGYNSSPPTDDGAETSVNSLRWSNHTSKIGDPLRDAIQAIDAELQTAFDEILPAWRTNPTAEEDAAGLTPVNYQYPPGHIYRLQINTTPGTTDMTSALQDMLDFCCAYDIEFVAPAGIYSTSTTLDIDSFASGSPTTFIAEGGRVRIVCSDDTVPVCDISGRNQSWRGIWSFEHSSLPSSANTDAVGWRINDYLAYSTFENIQFLKNYGGIAPVQTGGPHTAFANSFGMLTILQFSGIALDWDSQASGASTPTFIAGCYINNFQDDGITKNETSVYPVQVKSADSLVFGHLHVEHMIAPGVVQTGSDAGALIASAIHLEGVEANAQNQWFDCLAGSGMVIDQLHANSCDLEAATIGGNTYGVFRVAAGSQIICQRFYETDNTVDITTWKVVRGNSPDIESAVWVNGGKVVTATGGTYTTILLTADTSQDLNSNLPSILRRWLGKDNFRVVDSPNNVYEWWSTGAPGSGAWTRGSIVHNETPSAGSNLGWICVAAGTPGTWVPMGIVQTANAWTVGAHSTLRDFTGTTTAAEALQLLETLIEDLQTAGVLP